MKQEKVQYAAKGNYIGSILQYGYKKVVRDGRKALDIVSEEAEIVRMIYDLNVHPRRIRLENRRMKTYKLIRNPCMFIFCINIFWGR